MHVKRHEITAGVLDFVNLHMTSKVTGKGKQRKRETK
jgi:hypothetical protein